MGSLSDQRLVIKPLGPYSSPLEIKIKFSDEHPWPFHMGVITAGWQETWH